LCTEEGKGGWRTKVEEYFMQLWRRLLSELDVRRWLVEI